MTSTTPTGPDKPPATAAGGLDDRPSGPHRDAPDNPGGTGEKGKISVATSDIPATRPSDDLPNTPGSGEDEAGDRGGPGDRDGSDDHDGARRRWRLGVGTPRRLREAVRRLAVRDLGVFAVYLLVAAYVTQGLWPPATRTLVDNQPDHLLEQWFLAHGTRLWTGDFSLVTHLMNSPDGINLMANASLILPGVLLAPVTLAFGAGVSFAVLAAGNMAVTAAGWYLIFSRAVGASRPAAFLGGLFCGFAPGLVAQSLGHLHAASQWLVPAIVWCVIRVARGARSVVSGVVLGLLVTLQLFSGEEILLLTAIGLGIFTVTYAVVDRTVPLKPFLVALTVAAVTAGVLIAYPVWIQYRGPQSVPNGPFSPEYFSADLASFPAFSARSLAGSETSARLAAGVPESTTFFGWPLLLALGVAAVWLWRRPLARAATITAVALLWLSLGPHIVLDGERTGFPGPYVFLAGLPVIDGALPTRFALAAVPAMAVVLVLAIDRVATVRLDARILALAAAACLLLPIMPAPLPTKAQPKVPAFITGGHWRDCVPDGGVLVPVPLPTPDDPDTLRWAAAADDRFGVPQGFFIGPYAAGGRASMGVYPQPTAQLLEDVQKTGQVPAIGTRERANAQADVTHWKATCIALSAAHPQADVLKQTLDGLYGQASRIADAWVWRVTP